MKRKSSLKRKTPLKRKTALKRGSWDNTPKKTLKRRKDTAKRQETIDKDREFFTMLWETHPTKKCDSCGVQLFGENLTLYHDHLLDKRDYPELRYKKENMALVCGTCHTNKSRGFPTDKHLELIKRAKQKLL